MVAVTSDSKSAMTVKTETFFTLRTGEILFIYNLPIHSIWPNGSVRRHYSSYGTYRNHFTGKVISIWVIEK